MPPRGRATCRWPRHFLIAIGVLAALAGLLYTVLFLLAYGFAAPPARAGSGPDTYTMARQLSHSVPPHVSAGLASCTGDGKTVWGSDLTVTSADHICGNVNVYGGNATIDGSVAGNVTVVGGDATVNGAINGNVTAIGGNIALGAEADVGGNVDALGGDIQKAPTALVGGNIEHGFTVHGITPLSWPGFTRGFVLRWWDIIFWGLASAVIAMIFPRQLRNVRSVVRREPVMSFAAGIGALIVGIVGALLLFITCVGIPVALVLGVAMWAAWVVGTVAIGLWIGEGLLRLGGAADRPPVLASVLGVLLLTLCESVPCAGGILGLVVGVAGLGASALTLLYSRQATAARARAF